MDILSNILRQSQLSGGVYFCDSFTSHWGLEVEESEHGVFHMLIDGSAKLGYNDKVITLNPGDIVALPYGASHWIAYDHQIDRGNFSQVTASQQLMAANTTPIDGHPVLSTLLCGYFRLDSSQDHPFLKGMPDCIHLLASSSNYDHWLSPLVIKMYHETRSPSIGSDLIVSRQVELLYIELVRSWLNHGAIDASFLSAASNPLIFKVLNLFHSKPQTHYQLDSLAREVGMSRASLTKKFHQLVGVAPMTYLAKWRIQNAASLLANSKRSIFDIALIVGYRSDSALSKKFKAEMGISPGEYRKKHG